MKEPRTHFGIKLREYRKQNQLTQFDLAILWEVDRSDLSRYETTQIPSAKLLKRLQQKININVFEWVTFELPRPQSITEQFNQAA